MVALLVWFSQSRFESWWTTYKGNRLNQPITLFFDTFTLISESGFLLSAISTFKPKINVNFIPGYP